MRRLKGRHFWLYHRDSSGQPTWLALSASAELSITCDVAEICSSRRRSKAYKPGRYSWRVSVNGLVAIGGFDEHVSWAVDGMPLNIAIGQLVSADGDEHVDPLLCLVGTAYISRISITGNVGGSLKYSAELVGTGDLDVADVYEVFASSDAEFAPYDYDNMVVIH